MSIDQKQYNALVTVLTAVPGFTIGLFERLMLCRLEDGQYVVWQFATHGNNIIEQELLFIDPTKAVEQFLNLRDELQLGYDFEGETAK